jgi:hypothetical protein
MTSACSVSNAQRGRNRRRGAIGQPRCRKQLDSTCAAVTSKRLPMGNPATGGDWYRRSALWKVRVLTLPASSRLSDPIKFQGFNDRSQRGADVDGYRELRGQTRLRAGRTTSSRSDRAGSASLTPVRFRGCPATIARARCASQLTSPRVAGAPSSCGCRSKQW